MKPTDNLNNLSKVPCGSALDSTTENNSESSDELGSGAGYKKRTIQGLKRTIKQNQAKINDQATRLTIADIQLASEKEKTKDKNDVIKALKSSIDVITQSKDIIIKTLQSQVIELQTGLDLGKNQTEIKDKSGQSVTKSECGQHKTNVHDLSADIEILECKLKNRNQKLSELDNKAMKYEIDLKEKDELIAKIESQAKTDRAKIKQMEDKLSQLSLEVDARQLNSNSSIKVPLVRVLSLPLAGRFAAVFEDLPSAGLDWLIIQRRIYGGVAFQAKLSTHNYNDGFGDLGAEFWLGCDKLHELTTIVRYELYIELVYLNDVTRFARYDHFVVGSQAERYKLKRLGQYSGDAGDAMRGCEYYNVLYGWWIGGECNLNGKYKQYGPTDTKGALLETDDYIYWSLHTGRPCHLKSCKMLIKPHDIVRSEINSI